MSADFQAVEQRVRDGIAALFNEIEGANPGLLVGGTLTLCRWEGRWVPERRLTVRRELPPENGSPVPVTPIPEPPGAEAVGEVLASFPPEVVRRADPIGSPPASAPVGDICAGCGGCNFKPSGTCKVCLDCGTSGGCS